MGKQVAQGTRYESRIREKARQVNRDAMRLPKTGKKMEPDVFIPGANRRAAVAWESWHRPDPPAWGPYPRRTARRMVTITEEHFFELLAQDTESNFGYWVQCKSSERLSMRTILDGLLTWIDKNGGRIG